METGSYYDTSAEAMQPQAYFVLHIADSSRLFSLGRANLSFSTGITGGKGPWRSSISR
jgi:hypothetical protein